MYLGNIKNYDTTSTRTRTQNKVQYSTVFEWHWPLRGGMFFFLNNVLVFNQLVVYCLYRVPTPLPTYPTGVEQISSRTNSLQINNYWRLVYSYTTVGRFVIIQDTKALIKSNFLKISPSGKNNNLNKYRTSGQSLQPRSSNTVVQVARRTGALFCCLELPDNGNLFTSVIQKSLPRDGDSSRWDTNQVDTNQVDTTCCSTSDASELHGRGHATEYYGLACFFCHRRHYDCSRGIYSFPHFTAINAEY